MRPVSVACGAARRRPPRSPGTPLNEIPTRLCVFYVEPEDSTQVAAPYTEADYELQPSSTRRPLNIRHLRLSQEYVRDAEARRRPLHRFALLVVYPTGVSKAVTIVASRERLK